MISNLYLASGNLNKIAEIQEMAALSGLDIQVLSPGDVGGMPDVTEDAGTFVGNARKKALALKALLPDDAWVLSDDSGICVDALGGDPGVESAYYAGPTATGGENLNKLIRELADVPDDRRGARYSAVFYLAGPSGESHVFEGRCHGRLLRVPRGSYGFAYDPIFVPDGHEFTFAEISREAKSILSHRGAAWKEFVNWVRSPK